MVRTIHGSPVLYQMPMLNVFTRKDGEVRHFWGSELLYADCDDGQARGTST